MNVLLATQQYVNEMIRLTGPGMKVILMDKETVSCFSSLHTHVICCDEQIIAFPNFRPALSHVRMRKVK
jgi:hypothetical protein